MKAVIYGILGIALIAGPFGAATAVAQTAAAKTDDHALRDRIEDRVHKDATLGKQDIKVTVDHSVATLTGKVGTSAEKTRASRLANIKGITRVDNQIVVDRSAKDAAVAGTREGIAKSKSASKTAVDKTKSASKTAAGKTKSAVATAGEKTATGVKKAGNEVTDAWILGRIKADFVGEDRLKGSNIDVDCDKHIVTLKGTVPSEAGHARALEIARKTEGVTRVVDRLTIGPRK